MNKILDTKIDVSIIIVNYNTCNFLQDCLESVLKKTLLCKYEIIVVDNASTDGSPTMIKTHFPTVNLIESQENIGFGRANNLGSTSAKGRYLFFLNSDTQLINDAISILVEFLDRTPNCAIAGGNLTDPNNLPIHSFSRTLPSPFTDLKRLLLLFRKISTTVSDEYNITDKPQTVAYITGADMMIRTDLFRQLNGFDPDFFMYYEETELTHRVRKKNFLTYSVPHARIMHIKGGSLEKLDSVKNVVYSSKYLYIQKVYGSHALPYAHFSFLLYCRFKRLFHCIKGKKEHAKLYTTMIQTDQQMYRKHNTRNHP